MQERILAARETGPAIEISFDRIGDPELRWIWVDLQLVEGDGVPDRIIDTLALDPVAVRDAMEDRDLPKVADLGDHLLVVLHGLTEERFGTSEIDCFLTSVALLTLRTGPSRSVDSLWEQLGRSEQLAAGGADELLARLSDVLCRRFVAIVDSLDDRLEELTEMALRADGKLLGELVAVRHDAAAVRRAIHPQREALDELRRLPSAVLSDAGRHRFSDAYDVADRTAHGIDSARSALSEVLDAYRGAEARMATDVTRVLTVYAAVMLPLTLVVGFFGMNFADLPGLDREGAWLTVTMVMAAVAAVSLGIFVAIGWIRPLSPRRATATLGRGLLEASKAPVQIAGALYGVAASPLRWVGGRRPTDAGSDP
jgi:magnesium transporter